jgi:DNA-binding MarR family transcriptional regulator
MLYLIIFSWCQVANIQELSGRQDVTEHVAAFTDEWRLLTSHGLTFVYLLTHRGATTREVVRDLDLTERYVRRILDDLQKAGLIKAESDGRRNHYYPHPPFEQIDRRSRTAGMGKLLATPPW